MHEFCYWARKKVLTKLVLYKLPILKKSIGNTNTNTNFQNVLEYSCNTGKCNTGKSIANTTNANTILQYQQPGKMFNILNVNLRLSR